ncbi:NF-kappa-B inhibitor-interacting Ras-like protein 2 [Striga asiatica]|uniref:NF-kappa-B inhibitor-interacting Ras-like protein 2 n=1 Tax=Striga asiatica TaxID=4170 RepID=A0A5A7RDL0_STRAF|nr:NF-kappa-B inhibitor-interacting Ras-like protein 2 [Striga asiatica]
MGQGPEKLMAERKLEKEKEKRKGSQRAPPHTTKSFQRRNRHEIAVRFWNASGISPVNELNEKSTTLSCEEKLDNKVVVLEVNISEGSERKDIRRKVPIKVLGSKAEDIEPVQSAQCALRHWAKGHHASAIACASDP